MGTTVGHLGYKLAGGSILGRLAELTALQSQHRIYIANHGEIVALPGRCLLQASQQTLMRSRPNRLRRYGPASSCCQVMQHTEPLLQQLRGSDAVQAGIEAGNINLASAGIQFLPPSCCCAHNYLIAGTTTIGLSESSLAAQEKHAELLYRVSLPGST